mgnify:CR=1 FL=1
MNGGDMDVYLTSNRIHYLCEESIQKYSTLKFKTKQGELVMMNPTILAALNSTLVLSLHQGFVNHDLKIACYTDHEIFERYHKFKLKI